MQEVSSDSEVYEVCEKGVVLPQSAKWKSCCLAEIRPGSEACVFPWERWWRPVSQLYQSQAVLTEFSCSLAQNCGKPWHSLEILNYGQLSLSQSLKTGAHSFQTCPLSVSSGPESWSSADSVRLRQNWWTSYYESHTEKSKPLHLFFPPVERWPTSLANTSSLNKVFS